MTRCSAKKKSSYSSASASCVHHKDGEHLLSSRLKANADDQQKNRDDGKTTLPVSVENRGWRKSYLDVVDVGFKYVSVLDKGIP